SLIAEQASEQRGLLAYSFAQDQKFEPIVLADLQTAQEEQAANLAEFSRVATLQQVDLYQNRVQGSLVDFARSYENQAIQVGVANQKLNVSPITANEWYGAMSTGTIAGIRSVEQDLAAATIARVSALRQSAIITASVIGVAILIVLLLVLLLTALVWRRTLRQRRTPSLRTTALG
ncbi:MAG TPA: nitrate- and nitrite sensing domain-containing protein, partial [Streptosporangiaceae bacterium]|nr:nitrate- and nitrite sensing domain-containing protein [Streptosporangiaceae bacterium]